MLSTAVAEQWANAGLKTHSWERTAHDLRRKEKYIRLKWPSHNTASWEVFWGHRQFWVIIMLATHVKLTQKKNKCYLGRHLTRVWHTATVFTCIAVRFRKKPPNTGADFSSGQIILIQWLNIRDHESLPHCIRVHHSRSKTEKREEGDAESNETQSNSHPLLSRDHSIGTAKGR